MEKMTANQFWEAVSAHAKTERAGLEAKKKKRKAHSKKFIGR